MLITTLFTCSVFLDVIVHRPPPLFFEHCALRRLHVFRGAAVGGLYLEVKGPERIPSRSGAETSGSSTTFTL